MKELKEIEFLAVIHKITTDNEGESKITFTVSRQFLANAISLNLFLEKLLKIKVEVEENQIKPIEEL